MNGTLDRAIEDGLCAAISERLPIYSQVQCVPNLRGAGESDAVLPRIVIMAESQDTPELRTVGVFAVNVTAQSIVVGTDEEQVAQLSGMNSTIDSLLQSSNLPNILSNSRLQVYGTVIGGETQTQEENRMIRARTAVIHARLR